MINSSTPRTERYDTIVIGAGQAGLAAGYHLAACDADFLILDSASRVGESWRRRWDSLRLFTPAKFSSLPGLPFPAPSRHLPGRDEVASYLERYAEHFDLPLRFDTTVESLSRNAERFVLKANGIRYEADHVIVATGPFQRPRIPAPAAALSPAVYQVHSSHYTNPFDLPLGAVLVVGAANSGAQIALELARFRQVTLAGRVPGRLPRTILGVDLYTLLWPVARRMTLPGGRRRTDPLIGISEVDFARAGIDRVRRFTGVENGLPVCDGRALDARVVIWATGFSPGYRWIHLPVPTEDGYPLTSRGVVPTVPGLYFVGLRYQHRLTSALLGGVGDDAKYIVDQIARVSAMA